MLRKQKDLDAAAAKARKPGDLHLTIIYLTVQVGREERVLYIALYNVIPK